MEIIKKPKTIFFVTSNEGKLIEITNLIKQLKQNINIEHMNIDLLEPQSLDIKEISNFKAKYAWKKLKKPLIVDDGGIFFDGLNNFPGAMAKYVLQGIGISGILKLISNGQKATFRNVITFTNNGTDTYTFEGICKGKLIIPEDLDNIDQNLPYTTLFYPEGKKESLLVLKRKGLIGDFHHRIQAIKKFTKWYCS